MKSDRTITLIASTMGNLIPFCDELIFMVIGKIVFNLTSKNSRVFLEFIFTIF